MSTPVPPTVGGGRYGDDQDLSLRSTSEWVDRTVTGFVESVVAGTNVNVDNTDPANPIVSSTASGGALLVATANLTAQDIHDLPTTAFEIVPAAGEGTIVIPLSMLFMGVPATSPFVQISDFQGCYTNSENGDDDEPAVIANYQIGTLNRPDAAILQGTEVRIDYAMLQPNLNYSTPWIGFATITDQAQSWQDTSLFLTNTPIKLWSKAEGGDGVFGNNIDGSLDSIPALASIDNTLIDPNQLDVTAPVGTGSDFNAGSIEVGGATGAGNENRAMSVSWDGGTFTMTIALGTDGSGDYDDTKNTFALVSAAILLLPEGFTTSFSDGAKIVKAGSYPFHDGINEIDMGLRVVTWYVVLELPT